MVQADFLFRLASRLMTKERRRISRIPSSLLQPFAIPNHNPIDNNMANVALIGSTGMVVSFNHSPNPALATLA